MFKLKHMNKFKGVEEIDSIKDKILYKTSFHQVKEKEHNIYISNRNNEVNCIEHKSYVIKKNGCLIVTPKNEIYISYYAYPILKLGYVIEGRKITAFDVNFTNISKENKFCFVTIDDKNKQIIETNMKDFQEIEFSYGTIKDIYLLDDKIAIRTLFDTYIIYSKYEVSKTDFNINSVIYLYHINKWYIDLEQYSFLLNKKSCRTLIDKGPKFILRQIENDVDLDSLYVYVDKYCEPAFIEYQSVILYSSNDIIYISKTTYPFELVRLDITLKDAKIIQINSFEYDGSHLKINAHCWGFEYGMYTILCKQITYGL